MTSGQGPRPRLRPRPVRTVFLGSGEFGIESLRRLGASPEVELVAVVTAPPRPAGRAQTLTRTPIHALADELRVPAILTPTRLRAPESVAEVLALEPTLLVLADYGRIVPAALLDRPNGALNLHPSLLPRHRGATPIPAAILAGDVETGVTLMRMDEGLDTGPIVAQVRLSLTGTETSPTLERRLATMAAALLEDHLGAWIQGEIVATPQAEAGATLTRPLRREDGRLDSSRTASELDRQIRAYVPWPGSFIEIDGLGRLVVDDATIAPSEPGDIAGRLVADGHGLAIATSDGRLRLGRVRVAGRKPMSSADLRRGTPGLVGSVVR